MMVDKEEKGKDGFLKGKFAKRSGAGNVRGVGVAGEEEKMRRMRGAFRISRSPTGIGPDAGDAGQ